jgi:hypothetical protein
MPVKNPLSAWEMYGVWSVPTENLLPLEVENDRWPVLVPIPLPPRIIESIKYSPTENVKVDVGPDVGSVPAVYCLPLK